MFDETQRGLQICDQKCTFAEAKQNLPEYDENSTGYADQPQLYDEHSFLEIDEEFCDPVAPVVPAVVPQQHQYRNQYSASDSKVRYDDDDKPKQKICHTVRSAESYLNDHLPEYSHPDDTEWNASKNSDGTGRRKSKDFINKDDVLISPINEESTKRSKHEAMRSVSEDVPQRVTKPITRRSFSHPEKETQA